MLYKLTNFFVVVSITLLLVAVVAEADQAYYNSHGWSPLDELFFSGPSCGVSGETPQFAWKVAGSRYNDYLWITCAPGQHRLTTAYCPRRGTWWWQRDHGIPVCEEVYPVSAFTQDGTMTRYAYVVRPSAFCTVGYHHANLDGDTVCTTNLKFVSQQSLS